MIEKIDRYEIIEEIGAGGFAIVYKGRDTTLDRQVALKELRPHLLQNKSWVKRFQQEAKTIAHLDHPHIVPIFDIHEAQSRLFIVMRLVEGHSLEQLINEQGRLPWQKTMGTMQALCDGLDYAHKQGILHRDLKPANILIDSRRGPMLSDFGLAKIIGQHSMSLTDSQSVIGTPHYIAPEVWEGNGTSHQSDIYALGCILYELLTGEKVIKGETPPAVMMAHFKPLVLPTSWPEGVPEGVGTVLKTALAQDPSERYTTPAEMLKALFSPETGQSAAVVNGVDNSGATMGVAESQASMSQKFSGLELADSAPPQSASTAELPHIPFPIAHESDVDLETTTPVLPLRPDFETASQVVVHPQTGAYPTAQAAAQSTPLPQHPYATPPDWSQPTVQRPKRFGCLKKGTLIGVGIMMLLIIGLGGFCLVLSNNVGSSFEFVSNLLANNITIREIVSEDIHIPLPDEEKTSRLDLEFAAGTLIVTSGAKDALLRGTATYNVAMLKPKVVSLGPNIRLTHEGDTKDLFLLTVYDFINTEVKSVWDLKLGEVPMALNINTDSGDGMLELGPISLVDMSINLGAAGSFDLSFLEANQVEMETLDFASSLTKRINLSGLAYARVKNINFTSHLANETTFDFSGDLQNDIKVYIYGEDPVAITIIIPEGTNAEVFIKQESETLDIPESWQKKGQSYLIAGDGPLIFIEIDTPIESLKLRNQ